MSSYSANYSAAELRNMSFLIRTGRVVFPADVAKALNQAAQQCEVLAGKKPEKNGTMVLTTRQITIVRAALTELEQRMQRGLANSGLSQETVRMLGTIHDSEVTRLLDKIDANNV